MLTTTASNISPSIQQQQQDQRLLSSGESSSSESSSESEINDDDISLSSSTSLDLSQRQNQGGGDPKKTLDPPHAPFSSVSPRSTLDFPDQNNINPAMIALSSCTKCDNDNNSKHDENDGNNNSNNNYDENTADNNNNKSSSKCKFQPPKAPINNVIRRVSFSTFPNEHVHIDLGTDCIETTGTVVNNNDDSFTTLMTATSTIIEEEEEFEEEEEDDDDDEYDHEEEDDDDDDDDDEYDHDDDDDDEYNYEDEDKFDIEAREINKIITATRMIENTAAKTNSRHTSTTTTAARTGPSPPAPITATTRTTTSPTTTKETRRKKIRWSGRVRVHEIRHINNIPDDERELIWMSPIDYTMIKVMAKTTVYKMMSGEHINDDNPDFCTRGLEFRTRSGSRIRNANKMRNRSAVLNEQDLQHEEGFYDPEFIAMASMDESFICREAARKRAENDTKSIQSYTDDVRDIVWGLRPLSGRNSKYYLYE